MIELKIPIALRPGAIAPEYATPGSAGMDLRSVETVTLQPMERKLIGTGVSIAVPEGFEAQVRPRSGLAIKHGITMLNTPGTIDSDYRGEIKVIAINLGQEAVTLEAGQRVAQLVIAQIVKAELHVDMELEKARGEWVVSEVPAWIKR